MPSAPSAEPSNGVADDTRSAMPTPCSKHAQLSDAGPTCPAVYQRGFAMPQDSSLELMLDQPCG